VLLPINTLQLKRYSSIYSHSAKESRKGNVEVGKSGDPAGLLDNSGEDVLHGISEKMGLCKADLLISTLDEEKGSGKDRRSSTFMPSQPGSMRYFKKMKLH
jgi:hypothetical protein